MGAVIGQATRTIRSTLANERGAALVVGMMLMVALTLLGMAGIMTSTIEVGSSGEHYTRVKALNIAETGANKALLELKLKKDLDGDGAIGSLLAKEFDDGTYVVVLSRDKQSFIATGKFKDVERRIMVTFAMLAPLFDYAIYANNSSTRGGKGYTFRLGGRQPPFKMRVIRNRRDYRHLLCPGCPDLIDGNLYINGNVHLKGESDIDDPNDNVRIKRRVDTTTSRVINNSSASTDFQKRRVKPIDPPDLAAMDYPNNNDVNVTTNPHRFFRKNPPCARSRAGLAMCQRMRSTKADDYFLQPPGGRVRGRSTVNLGKDKVYFVDGDLWIDDMRYLTITFKGQATVVVRGNIHIGDNLIYENFAEDMLGLISIKRQDGSGGNIYFSDPQFQVRVHRPAEASVPMHFSGMLLAENDFLFNTSKFNGQSKKPRQSGFTINGNIAALNQMKIDRDWYDANARCSTRRCTHAFPGKPPNWRKWNGRSRLTKAQKLHLKHHQLNVNYDERVLNANTRPPGFPQGLGEIFDGTTAWLELKPEPKAKKVPDRRQRHSEIEIPEIPGMDFKIQDKE